MGTHHNIVRANPEDWYITTLMEKTRKLILTEFLRLFAQVFSISPCFLTFRQVNVRNFPCSFL